jgi:phosphoserine phosphatase
MVEKAIDISDKRLAVLDLHGTLTPVMSIWQFILEGMNLWQNYSKMVVKLRQGELTYKYCCETITNDLKGTSLKDIQDIISGLPFADGVIELIEFFRERGIKVWFLTSGLGHVCKTFEDILTPDKIISNWFETDEKDNLTGELIFDVDMGGKGSILKKNLGAEGYIKKDCLAMGDTANDIDVFNQTSFSIAVSPKDEKLKSIADISIDISELKDLVSILGG